MIVLVGESASGKTEIAKLLAASYGLIKMITATTRPARINEINGKDYFFMTKEQFEENIKKEIFVEYTKYDGNYYGSLKSEISDDKVIVVDPSGYQSYLALKDDRIVSFFLKAGEETRFKRMIDRKDSEHKARERLLSDRKLKESFENIHAHFEINTEINDPNECAKIIFDLYQKELKKRKKIYFLLER